MSHLRTQVRAAIVGFLTDTTDAGSNVFDSRITPFRGPFPAISVYTMSERPSDMLTLSAPRKREIILDIEIDVVVEGNEGYASALDTLCAQIEAALPWDINHLVEVCDYAGTDTFLEVTGDRIFALAKIKYEAYYTWAEGATLDAGDADDLDKVNTQWDMVDHYKSTVSTGPDGQIDAADDLDFE